MAADGSGKGTWCCLVGVKEDYILLQLEERRRGDSCCLEAPKE